MTFKDTTHNDSGPDGGAVSTEISLTISCIVQPIGLSMALVSRKDVGLL